MDLTKDNIPTLIRQIAIPSSIGTLFQTLYNIVDVKFAGLISPDAITAIAKSFPIYFIIIGFTAGLSIGVTALISTIVGSFVYSLISNNLRIEWFANKHDFIRHFIGAVLIGIGGVLALGCTIGQGVSGVSTLAIGSIITLLSIIFGASLMMKIEYYKAVYEESSFIELLKNALVDLKVLPGKLRTLEKI